MTMHLPVQHNTVEQIVELRNAAIGTLGAQFDLEQEANALHIERIKYIKAAGYRLKPNQDAPWDKVKVLSEEEIAEQREAFINAETRDIDRGLWEQVVEASGIEKLMDTQSKEELYGSLRSDDLPELSIDNIWATLEQFRDDSHDIFQRGIANVFSKLDRRFKSHDGFKIGSRIIFNEALNEFGSWNYYRKTDDRLRDVERTFFVLDGEPVPEKYMGIAGLVERHATWDKRDYPKIIESEYFRIKLYKNGNIHVWFLRDDLVRKVNRHLADYYGEVLGEGADVADVSDMGPSYHVAPARNLGFYPTSKETADLLWERMYRLPKAEDGPVRFLEPSAGTGVLAEYGRRSGYEVVCVELDPERAQLLRSKGYTVHEGDFTRMTAEDLGAFDVIMMNPPFDRGRDCDHVRHALDFLKPGGVLGSIMSVSAEHAEDTRRKAFRAYLKKHTRSTGYRWRDTPFDDLPERSFAHAGTNINTVTCAVVKNDDSSD